MPFFGRSKPRDLAGIYVAQTHDAVDTTQTSVFPPDQALAPGDVAVVQNGQIVRSGSVTSRGLTPVLAPASATAAWSYATDGSVTFGPSVQIPNPVPGGSPLVKATLSFSRDRSVVASFNTGSELRVADSQSFGAALMQLWFARRLRPDELVVWWARVATGGTVVVSAEGGNSIELSADSSLLGGLGITLDGLSAVGSFGSQTKASYHVSDAAIPFTTAVRLFTLPPAARAQLDGFGFADDPDSVRSAAADFTPTTLSSSAFATLVDTEDPDDDEA